jgi:hypothetical protein
MPHQCTECGRTFPDGSKEMLSGCPDCGGNKFQFKPADAVDVGSESASVGADADASASGEDAGGAMSRAKATVRDLMGRGDGEDASSGGVSTPSAGAASDQAAAGASEAAGNQTSISEFSTASDASTGSSDASTGASAETSAGAADAADAAEAAGAAGRSTSSDDRNVTPSGSGEWPKSATEEYDTPAEKARRRQGSGEDGPVDAPDSSSAGESTSTRDSPGAGESTSTRDSSAPGESASSPMSSDAGSAAGDVAASDAAAGSSDDEGGITAQMGETEDDAQRSARSDVVSPDELPNHGSTASSVSMDDDQHTERADRPPSRGDAAGPGRDDDGPVTSESDGDSPNLDQLREELNSQFESIKVLNPGKYELNLMELYDREEYIISLQEDGRYVIEVPESWRGDASPD